MFTSGGTEGNNWGLKGVVEAKKNVGNHVIVSAIEHPSVLQTAKYLENQGIRVSYVKPDATGQIRVEEIERLLCSNTVLVSVMFVNNETGVINPVEEIGELCQENNVTFHCDGVQAFGKINFSLQQLPVDIMTLSAHKIHGPKGVGAVYIKSGTPMQPFIHGGHQEANLRAGTENVTGIVGFETVTKLIREKIKTNSRVKKLQAYFEKSLVEIYPQAKVVGENAPRSPFISQIAFPGIDHQSLLMKLDLAGVAVSVGSACSSGSVKPSHVLRAMGLSEKVINSSIRCSFSYSTTADEIDFALEQFKKILA